MEKLRQRRYSAQRGVAPHLHPHVSVTFPSFVIENADSHMAEDKITTAAGVVVVQNGVQCKTERDDRS